MLPLQSFLSSLPEFSSADRTESLYSDFSETRLSNPAGFNANNAAWTNILTGILRLGLQPVKDQQHQDPPDRLVLHLNQLLLEALRRPKIGKPYGLVCPLWTLSSLSSHSPSHDAVFAPLSSFLSTAGWGPATGITHTITRSISWVSRTLTRGSLFDPDQRFHELDLNQKLDVVMIDWVHLSLLQQAADVVIERYQEKFVGLSPSLDCLYTYSQLREELTSDIFPSSNRSNLQLSKSDLRVLIKHLERDRRVLVSDKDVVKFILPKSIETDRHGRKFSSVGPAPINQLDRGILSVKQTIQQLNQQIRLIGVQIDQRTQDAKKYVQLAQPEMASSQLKSRKNLKHVLSQRIGVLETINGVYQKIEQASTDVEIMNAYENSTQTLKGLLRNPSLQREQIEVTMENLHQVLADQSEIDQTINETNTSTSINKIDDQEIAVELAGLIDDVQHSSPASSVPHLDTLDDLSARLDLLKVPENSLVLPPKLAQNLVNPQLETV